MACEKCKERDSLDSDPHGYLCLNPRIDAPARAVLTYPYRCAVSLAATYGIAQAGITMQLGSHNDLLSGVPAPTIFAGSVTLNPGQCLVLHVPAASDLAVATFKITKL